MRPGLTRSSGPLLVLASSVASFAVLASAAHDHAQAAPAASTATAVAVPAGLGPQARFTADQVTAGRQLYVVHCSSCHGAEPNGTANGPSLVDAGAASADFYLRTGRMPLNDPNQQPTRHRPAFPPDQIDQLVAYVASLGSGPAIPNVAPGHLANGNELFSINCAQCHNNSGAGGALGYGDIVPSLHRSSALDVAESMRVGPRPMPVFGPHTLTDQQVDDIATYVEYLHHPTDRGGAGLGHLGPLPEGFVAWVVGMGLLLAVARLVGTRG